MKVCKGSDEGVPNALARAVASDTFYGESMLRWPAPTMMLGSALQPNRFSVFVGFAGLPIARADQPVPPSNAKLKRLLAEATLEKAASKEDLQPVSTYGLAISDAVKHDLM